MASAVNMATYLVDKEQFPRQDSGVLCIPTERKQYNGITFPAMVQGSKNDSSDSGDTAYRIAGNARRDPHLTISQ